jgi:sporadic carbohydrate cluster 2OG-Fe(II) oxygenase
MAIDSFLTPDDLRLGEEFLEAGYVIQSCEELEVLEELKRRLLTETNRWLADHQQLGQVQELQFSHERITSEFINDIRLHLFAHLNSTEDTRYSYFRLASSLIQRLVGNELAMQSKVNLSIQQPGDQTSVLELHSDVWAGDSPFQVVLWVPFTDSTASNAMFLLKPSTSHEAYQRARTGELNSMDQVHEAYRSQFKPIEVKFGEVLIFNSNCLHGNQLNTTSTSRWSLNCRITSLLAPATTPERRLGAYYTPIMVRPATRMGIRALDSLGITA